MTLTELNPHSSIECGRPLEDSQQKSDPLDEVKSELSTTRRNFGPTKPLPGMDQVTYFFLFMIFNDSL